MKKLVSAALSIAVAASLGACGVTDDDAKLKKITPDVDREDVIPDVPEQADASLSGFCAEFHRISAENSDGFSNTLTSPLSAYISLSMVKEGASGDTLAQMSEVMGDVSGEDMYAIISHLTSLENTTLNIADSVWIDDKFDPKQDFFDSLAARYLAEGFKTELKYAERNVNLWIEEHTGGLIKNMLDDGALDDAVMAIVNALYMDAKWESEFSSLSTREMDFINADGSMSRADFMFKGQTLPVIESDEYIGVALDYSDGSLVFAALMPKDMTGTAASAVKYVTENGGWNDVLATALDEKVKLFLPKFEHSASGSLVDTLKQMGITHAFDKYTANFDGIAEEIYVQSVVQNTVLKLDEAGTEAAAATAVIAVATSAAPIEQKEPRTIRFDHPFAFAVIDTDTGAVLFAGEHNSAK